MPHAARHGLPVHYGPCLSCALDPPRPALPTPASAPSQRPGYVVPTEIMTHFFEDVHQNGTFTGFPDLGLQLQRMESPALRWGAQGCVMCRADRCMPWKGAR